MGTILRWIAGIIAVIVVIILCGLLFIYSGFYNVSATYPDSHLYAWVFDTAMTRSVQRHAAGIKVPNLNGSGMYEMGFAHYNSMCVPCHGAPGVPIGHVGKGLRPAPPELVDSASDWKPNELFWITKNGIRMTGMPAWGVTHSDQEIWAMVAFMQKLHSITPDEYRSLSKRIPPAD